MKRNKANWVVSSQLFLQHLVSKPLSLFLALMGMGLVAFAIYERWLGNVYITRLNYVDSTTLILIGLLLLRAVTKLDNKNDLETASMGIISVVSFIFAYEMVYKWSFYFYPWRMPPGELREFILQIWVSMVVMAGFAAGILRFSLGSKIALLIFLVGWVIWLSLGFPQLSDGNSFYVPLVNIQLSWGGIYAINRLTKVALFFFYFLLF
jgi:hypothetical protein